MCFPLKIRSNELSLRTIDKLDDPELIDAAYSCPFFLLERT